MLFRSSKSKAQLRDYSRQFAPYSSSWKRSGSYKSAAGYDSAVGAGDMTPLYDKVTGTCSNVACHVGQSVRWGATGGATTCVSCHTKL